MRHSLGCGLAPRDAQAAESSGRSLLRQPLSVAHHLLLFRTLKRPRASGSVRKGSQHSLQRCYICAQSRPSSEEIQAEHRPPPSTRLRVERQVHLPASRDEAWGALQHLVPRQEWAEAFPVFGALESIYRAEYHAVGEELLQAYQTANEALEEVDASSKPLSNKRQRSSANKAEQDTERGAAPEKGEEKAAASTSNGSGSHPAESQSAEHSSNGKPSYNFVSSNGSTSTEQTGRDDMNPRGSSNGATPSAKGAEGQALAAAEGDKSVPGVLRKGGRAAGDAAVALAEEVKEQVVTGVQEDVDDGSTDGNLPSIRQPAKLLQSKLTGDSAGAEQGAEAGQAEGPAEDRPIRLNVAESAVAFEDASRLEYDRSRRERMAQAAHRVDASEADATFVRLIVNVINKAHFMQLSARDDALSISLNSDYLAQMYISPDTKRMDRELIQNVSRDGDLPAEAKTMLIFKRGYGQARKRGRMLVPKLDYLQYIVVRAAITAVFKRGQSVWQSIRSKTSSATSASKEKLRSLNPTDQSDSQRTLSSQQSSSSNEHEIPTHAHSNGAHHRQSDSVADESSGGPQVRSSGSGHKRVAVVSTTVEEGGRKGEELAGTAKQARDKLGQAIQDWVSPRATVAGGGLYMSLSRWGLIPSSDVLPLEDFNQAWKPDELEYQAPVYVERVSLRDALQGGKPETLLGNIELVEPTFQELLIVYRQTASHNWLAELKNAVMGDMGKSNGGGQLRRRSPIAIRLYRDIPVPTWRIVFPDKLLQFRPLDGLRSDLFSIAGILAFIAQAKYDSVILDIITLGSLFVLITRVVLGYKRMYDRFEQMANEMLANTTLAGQEGSLQYLAANAALQQFGQSALALLVLHRADGPLTAESLERSAEDLLEHHFQVKVHFNADEALDELKRLGQLEEHQAGYDQPAFRAMPPKEGYARLKTHWDSLLLQSSKSLLQEL